MKINQTLLAVGAVVAILIAIAALVYFLRPASQPLAPAVAPPAQIPYQSAPPTNKT